MGHRGADEREALILAHLEQVNVIGSIVIRRGRLPLGMDADDVRSAGILGLIEAVDRFDGTKGAQLKSFASWRIRGAMLDAIRQFRGSGARAKISPIRIDIEKSGVMRTTACTFPSPHEAAVRSEAASLLARLMRKLTFNERIVINGTILEESATTIAAKLGLCPSRVHQLRAAAIEKMAA